MATGYTRYPEDLKPRVVNLEGRYVRSTRFASISQTTGTITPPANSQIILDDFGGAIDAVVSTIDSGRPTLNPAYTAGGLMVTTSFDSGGNYVLSGTPSAYPVAILYRVRTALRYYDDTDVDICGPSTLEALPSIYSFTALGDTPDTYAGSGGKIVAVKSDMTGLEFTRNLIIGAPITFTAVDLLLDSTHYVVVCTAGLDITLPDATTVNETVYFIKKLAVGSVTIADTAGRLIDNQADFTLSLPYDSIMLVAGSGKWWII